MTTIELLAPARDKACAIAAITHGADAVYMGGPSFGARAAAGNSIEDIKEVCRYAHLFNARIYITLNTLLKEEELPEVERLIWQLWQAGIDALIIQDMAITRLNIPPVPLHASTQMDNRTTEKVNFLYKSGFRQIVLARELTLDEIHQIHKQAPRARLEVFVHGALCVSLSGRCYISEHMTGRSANRGECAQICRLPFNMEDADGRQIISQKHLLSMRDMNRSDRLEELIDAGATSFKIEGRLKDESYVKNITSLYRNKLDQIIDRRSDLCRQSSGKVKLNFTPQASKSFNRGFTHYFLDGRDSREAYYRPGITHMHDVISSPDTPKAIGEPAGKVKFIGRKFINIAGTTTFHNGDGLCYFNPEGKLVGFRVNTVSEGRLFPREMPQDIYQGAAIYRNNDAEFERTLARPTAERRIKIKFQLTDPAEGFLLTATDEDHNTTSAKIEAPHEEARTPQLKNIERQLERLGDTIFTYDGTEVNFHNEWFLPASRLAELRRQATSRLEEVRLENYKREEQVTPPNDYHYPTDETDLMTTRHCLRYSLGWCPVRQGGKSPFREPYYIVSGDGSRFRLEFDCKDCMMKVKEA